MRGTQRSRGNLYPPRGGRSQRLLRPSGRPHLRYTASLPPPGNHHRARPTGAVPTGNQVELPGHLRPGYRAHAEPGFSRGDHWKGGGGTAHLPQRCPGRGGKGGTHTFTPESGVSLLSPASGTRSHRKGSQGNTCRQKTGHHSRRRCASLPCSSGAGGAGAECRNPGSYHHHRKRLHPRDPPLEPGGYRR